jgi:hypothetical protein
MTRWLPLALLACLPALHTAEPAPPPKSGEFPLRGSERRITGELVEADFIHRTGQFRTEGNGVLVDFTLPPFGTVSYLNTEADLRDVPLGTRCVFFLYQDENGAFTRAAFMQDEASLLASQNGTANEDQQRATEQQRKKHLAFLKERGLPAIIDRVEGKKVTVTLLGDPASLAALCKDENLDPAKLAAEHKRVGVAVANEELRTYNPPVDQQGSNVLEYQSVPTDRFGCGGIRWVIQPNLLLEGFRKGRIVRIFKDGWPIKDMPYGESIYPEVFNSETVETDPDHYPFRTDFANPQLPWYQLQPGQFPPLHSAHLVGGELVKVNPAQRTGQFRTDRTGDLVEFTLPPFAAIVFRNAEADLADIPLGTRCLFSLHQDAKGAFTQASRITDEFTHLVSYRVTYRLDTAFLDQDKLLVARHLPPMKDERDAMIQPPDLGRMELAVSDQTRVWKGDKQVPLTDLAPGDELLFNRTARTPTGQGRCADIWAGVDTHKAATEQQRTAHQALRKKNGHPAWIDSVNGKQLTITFFAASRSEFSAMVNYDPKGRTVYTLLCDQKLQPQSPTAEKMNVVTRLPEGNTAGTYGCSGVRWLIEPNELPADYRAGQIIRVLEEAPSTP